MELIEKTLIDRYNDINDNKKDINIDSTDNIVHDKTKFRKDKHYQLNTEEGVVANEIADFIEGGDGFAFYLEYTQKLGASKMRNFFARIKGEISEKKSTNNPVRRNGAYFNYRLRAVYPNLFVIE